MTIRLQVNGERFYMPKPDSDECIWQRAAEIIALCDDDRRLDKAPLQEDVVAAIRRVLVLRDEQIRFWKQRFAKAEAKTKEARAEHARQQRDARNAREERDALRDKHAEEVAVLRRKLTAKQNELDLLEKREQKAEVKEKLGIRAKQMVGHKVEIIETGEVGTMQSIFGDRCTLRMCCTGRRRQPKLSEVRRVT